MEQVKINLAGTPIGDGYPPYIVAEIGQNHNGDMHLAKQLIEMAVECGANAVKFQKRDIPSELTIDAYNKVYDNPNAFGETYGKHREFLEFNERQHKELKEFAISLGIIYFCTPTDIPSLEIMEKLDVPFFKVASRDLTNIPLLEEMGKLKKPVIISTGMASYVDIDDAVKALNLTKNKLIIMHCTSEYPCKIENVNLNVIKTLKDRYGCLVGYSDHTSGIIISVAAVLKGACIIEKHITLDRSWKGTDQAGSLERAGLKKLIEYISCVEKGLGNSEKEYLTDVEPAKNRLARSITSKENIKIGSTLTETQICLRSPGDGILWRNRNLIIGKQSKKNIPAETTLSLDDFE
tara:strand:- start:1016 stop:2065 length:1050 start_codon:yes stop_codon:yes gene_type:complete